MPNQAKNTNTSHRLHISNVVEANYHVAQYHVPMMRLLFGCLFGVRTIYILIGTQSTELT